MSPAFGFVIEHMEDDDEKTQSIPPWVELEYRHMLTLAGPNATVYFANLSKSSAAFLANGLADTASSDSSAKSVATHVGARALMEQYMVPLDRVCLLDPKAEKELSPEDGDGAFDWFLFGGILGKLRDSFPASFLLKSSSAGDDPPRDRTSELRTQGFPSRRLGPVQMTTDTALGVTKLVVDDKVPLESISYIDHPTIRFNAKESVEMPFRYIAKDGEPLLPPGMRDHIYADLNQSFEF